MSNRLAFIVATLLVLSGCAQLHKVQVGETMRPQRGKRFDIKVSENAIDFGEAKAIANKLTRDKKLNDGFEALSYFQMGPRTGVGVFNPEYARRVRKLVLEKCPSGKVSNLMSIRESRKYPVISGEIVKITGYCYK